MTKKARRRYTAEFKAAAVARLDETGETLSSVAQARIARVHPRWAEIQRFFAEQGVRQEIKRQCQERGIPLIED